MYTINVTLKATSIIIKRDPSETEKFQTAGPVLTARPERRATHLVIHLGPVMIALACIKSLHAQWHRRQHPVKVGVQAVEMRTLAAQDFVRARRQGSAYH
jgi:hypothetical protein